MRRGRPVAVALLAATLLLGGCGAAEEPFDDYPDTSGVEVDTAHLRELKAEAGVEPCEPGEGEPVDGGPPELVLPCLGGGKDVDLASLRGPLVINLWASWCGSCRTEMPVLQEFHEKYADRVPLIGIDWQDVQVEAALDLVATTGVTYPLLADPDGEWGIIDGMPVRGLPGIVLIDEDGTIAYRNLEVIESTDELVGLVEDHLGVTL